MKTIDDMMQEFLNSNNGYGDVKKMFLLHAMNYYAAQVISKKEMFKEQMKNSIIAPNAWIGCAEEWFEIEKKCRETVTNKKKK